MGYVEPSCNCLSLPGLCHIDLRSNQSDPNFYCIWRDLSIRRLDMVKSSRYNVNNAYISALTHTLSQYSLHVAPAIRFMTPPRTK